MADPISATVVAIGSAITAASGAAAGAALALTGSATIAAVAGNAVLGLASWQTALTVAGFAASALLTPQVNIEGRPTDWRADPNAGIPFVMGERATSGIIIHRDAYGKDNRLQSIVTVYSGAGPIQSFDQFYADEVAMSFDANGEASNGGNFAGNMWLYTTPGNQPQSAALANNAVLNSQIGGNAFEGWGSTSKISGKAHALLTLRQDSKLETYAGGIPRTRFKMRGIKMYDPRLDSTVAGGSGSHRVADQSTYAYSENPAIAALNWCLGLKENGVVVGGIGATVEGIDLPAFIEWANVCDANGWTVSAVPTSADDKHQVLLALLQAGGARYSRFQGKMSCIVRTPRTSVVTLSADDTAGLFEVDLNADRLSRTNTITPRCVMESHDWEMVAQDPVSEASYVTADGGERSRGIDYPYVSIKATNANKNQPAELAAYAIVDSRETIAGTVPLKPWGAQIEPGDVFTIDEPGFLLDGVELLCLRREFDLASNVVRISFISESAGKHTYALGLNPTPPSAPNLAAPDIYTVDAPGVGVWSAAAASGNQPAIIVTGDADQLSAREVIVEYRTQNDPSDGQPWAGADQGWVQFAQSDISTSTVDITGLEPNAAYEVSVRYISQFGIIGDRRNLGAVTTGGLTATNSDQLQGFDAAHFDDQAQAIRQDARNIRDDARGALAEMLALANQNSNLAGFAADENAVRKTEVRQLEVRADNADASFENILTLAVDPGFALAQNTTQLRTEFEFELDANNDGSLADQIQGRVSQGVYDEAVTTLAQADRAAVDANRKALAETAFTASSFRDGITLIADRERALFSRVLISEVEIQGVKASFEDVLSLSVDPSSALAINTNDLRAEFEFEINSQNDGSLADQASTALSQISDLDAATAEADRAQARRLSRTLAEIAANTANAVDATNALVDDQRSEVTRATQLRSEFDDVSADVSVLASAYTDGAGNALASFSVVTAASGSNPAIVQLKSGDGASDAAIVADRVMLGNLGPSEDEIRPVFLAQNGKALFNEQVTIFDDITAPTTAVILGPNIGSDGLTLWAGAASDASSPTLANAQLALGASAGARVDGTVLIDGYEVNRLFTSSPASTRAIIDGDSAGRVICRADIEGVRNLNQWTLIGSNVVFGSPGTGTMGTGDIAIFRFRVFATGPDASPVAENGNFGSLGVTAKQVGGSWDIHLSDTGTISVKSAYISGNPTISVDDFLEEIEQTNVRYTDTGDCYLYFVGFWVSTDAADSAGITLPFTTSTEIAMTNLLNRNTGA